MSKEQPTEFPAQDEHDLEEYGVWVKSGPEDIDEGPDESPDSTMEDLDTSPPRDELALTDEEEELLAELDDVPIWDADQDGGSGEPSDNDLEEIDLDFDLDIDDSIDETAAQEPSVTDDSSELALDDFDLGDHSETQSDRLEQIGEDEQFDLEQISLPDDEPFNGFEFSDSDEDDDERGEDIPELDIETEETPESVASEQSRSGDNSTSTELAEVLQSVQAELGEIKREMADIRSQVVELRSAAVAPGTQDSSRLSLEQELAEGGFFEEGADEDDETIALTGDELDNILNTAEFVEEPAQEEPLSEEPLGEQLGEHSETPRVDRSPAEQALDQDPLGQPELDVEQPSDAHERSEPVDALNQGFDGELTIEDLGFEPTDQDGGEVPQYQDQDESLLPPDIDVIPVDLGDKPPSSDEHEHETLLDEDLPLDELQDLSDSPGASDSSADDSSADEASADEASDAGELQTAEPEPEPASGLDQETQDSGFDFTLEDISFEDETEDQEIEEQEQSEHGSLEGLEIDDDMPAVDENELADELASELVEPATDELELDELQLDELAPEHGEASAETEEASLGSDDGLDALAEMDIDSELAGIEELSDTPSDDDLELSTDELDGIRFDLEDEHDDGAHTETEIELESFEDQDADVEELSQTSQGLAQESAPDRSDEIPGDLREEIRSVLHYMDQLLEALPEDKIQEFAESEHFEVYKRLFEELGLEQ